MAALDSLYDKVLNEAWSKTIAGNGKNTLLVHTQAEFKPEDTYYVFVCKPVTAARTNQKYTWQTTPSLIDFSIGGNEENWSNIRIIEDKLVKGSDVVSYIKGKETKLLSGITQYILDLRYINTTVKDAVYASLHTSTKTGPGRFAAGYYFVNANIAGQPSLKTYYNIVKLLWKSVTLDLDPMYAAAETLPYIDDLIKAGELNKKNAELTGGDWNPAGLLEAVNWDDPYPYGKVDRIVFSVIKSYNPSFTDADVKDAYSAFYGWLQKQEDLPDEMGVQEWYDNAVENFRDADQHERRGMDEDEEAAAEEGYIDAAENLLIQQLNAFFNGDSEEYKDFLNARTLNKKNAAATGGDWNPAGLLEGLQFDAGSEYFNYVDFCKEQGWSDEEIAEFSEWFATKSDMAEDINDYGDPEDTEAWWKVGSYFDAAIENAGYDAREHQDPTILLDHINDVKATIARYYRQFKDYKQAQALNQKNAAATGGDWEPEGLLEGEEICEQATLNPNGELIFGKYRIFQAGSGTQTAPYAQAINNTNLFSNRLANDVKVLETLGFKFDTVYYYQPPPRSDGKYVARAIAISGTDNNGEDIMWVRKGGFMAPSPAIYYKDRRGGDVKRMARSLALQLKPANVVTAEDFLKAAVSPTAKIEKGGGWGYKRKKIKLRPDGKYDILGEVYLTNDYTKHLVGKPFVINSLDDLPVKFGVVVGQLTVKLPVLNIDWFPEKFDGLLYFQVEAGMTPERFLGAGLLDRVTDDTEISFTTGEVDKFGFNKKIKFKSKADWIDTIKAHELNKKNAEITGGDWNPAGLLETADADGRVTEFVKALIEVDNFEDFKRIAKQLPDLSNTINGTPVGLLIKDAVSDNIGSLQGDGTQSLWFPTTPQDFFYKALYYYLRYHSSDSKSSRAFNRSLSYRQGPSLEEVEQAFNKWLDSKQAKDLEKKNAAATGGDWNPAGLLESWTDKDIEDYWEHYYNVGDPGPIGAIKNWPGLSFFNSWFVDMIDRENWNVDSIEDYFIEYSDRVADNLEQKDNEDRGYGELQEIACYRGYKKLYSYYRQFLSDTNSPFYKDWKATEELNQKNAAATGGDWNPAGLLESKGSSNKGKWVSIMLKAAEEVAQDPKALAMAPNKARLVSADFWTSIPPSDGSVEGIRENFLNAIKQAQNFDIQNGNFSPAKNKFKKMKYDPKRLGSLSSGYQVYAGDLSSPEAQEEIKKDFIYKANRALFYRMEAVAEKEYPGGQWYTIIGPLTETGNIIKDFVKGDLKEIKVLLKDYLDAQELDRKNAAATGGDWNPSGLLEQGTSVSKKPYITEFNSIITKAKDARTFNDFEAAFEGTDPNIWNTDTAGKFFHKVFVAYFNTELLIEPLVTINSKNDYERTKFGHLYEAINHYGEYLLLSRTDAEADRFSGQDARLEAALVYKKQAEHYFNNYIDIINAEELNKKNAAATGGDWNPAGLLEAYIWKGFSNEYLTVSFTKLIKKAAAANTFEEFLAAHDDVDPKIWSTAKAGASYFDTFKHIFNKDGTQENFVGLDTKLGALYRAIEHMGFYTVTAKTDHSPWQHNVGTKEYRMKSDLEAAKKYFDAYKDIVDTEELNKKNAAATGGDWNPAGLLESNKVFNPKIYDTYKKALEANSFEEFKELIKQLPDPWKYEVMVGGEANARAIIKDILKLKDFPSSYNPKTPADHFLTAIDHIFDVEHSTSVTLDDIRSGYAIAQEHFAKWLDYKKAKELEQKNAAATGGDWDPSGLLESQEQDNVTPERDKTLFFSTVENYKKYLPEISDADLIGFYDWFNNVKRVELGFEPHAPDNESSWEVYQQITYVAAEDEFGIPEHEISDEFRNVAEMMMDKLYDEYKAHLVNKKNAELTGGDWDPKGLLQEANRVLFNKRFALMKWARAIPNSNEFARQWALKSGFSEEDIENFGGQQWLIDGLIDWFVDMEGDRTKYQGGRIYDMGKLSLEQQIALYQKLEDDAVEEVKKHLEELYKDWIAAIELNKKNADVTGSDWDPKGLLEAARYTGPGGPVKDKQGKEHDYQGWYNIIKPFIIDLLKAVENNDFSTFVKLVDSRQKNMGGPGFNPYFNLVDKVYAKVLQELLDNEQAENAFDEAYSAVQSMIVYIDLHLEDQWDRDPNTLQSIPHAQIKQEYPRAVVTFNKFREIYKDSLDAKELDKKNVADTGGDWNPAGLLEAKPRSTPEEDNHWGSIIYEYINKLVNANTFEEFIGLVEDKPATFQFNPGMYYHDILFVNAINSQLGSHNKETGSPVRSSFVAAFSAIQGFVSYVDLFYKKGETTPRLEKDRAEVKKTFDKWIETRADWYAAQELDKKNAAATGGDWNPAGLLEGSRDVSSQEAYNRLLFRWKKGFIDEFKEVIKLPEEEGEKVYQWLLNKATETDSEEPRMYATKAEEVYHRTAALYAEFVEKADTPGVKYVNRYKAAMKLIYKVYLDELKAQELNQKNAAATGGDWNPAGLLESEDDDSSRERYWDNALEATATDWINSFKSYVGLERANKIYTWLLNKARVEHDSQATYNNLIDIYGQFARERKKKDGLNDWNPPDSAKVLADIADAYDADKVEQKNAAATGGDWDPKGLL